MYSYGKMKCSFLAQDEFIQLTLQPVLIVIHKVLSVSIDKILHLNLCTVSAQIKHVLFFAVYILAYGNRHVLAICALLF